MGTKIKQTKHLEETVLFGFKVLLRATFRVRHSSESTLAIQTLSSSQFKEATFPPRRLKLHRNRLSSTQWQRRKRVYIIATVCIVFVALVLFLSVFPASFLYLEYDKVNVEFAQFCSDVILGQTVTAFLCCLSRSLCEERRRLQLLRIKPITQAVTCSV